MSWLSKKLEKSKKNQTGIFSWDDAIKELIPEEGGLNFMGVGFDWGDSGMSLETGTGGPSQQADIMKYGLMALGAYVVIKIVGK